MRKHASYFKPFVNVAPVRRAPRRKVAATSKADLETHSQNEIDQAYEYRLQQMQNSGVFGDNLEIQAFAREFGVNVKIYQRKLCYVISADNESGNPDKDGKAVHIAYHRWEHYSSIRNRTGPHMGPPSVSARPVSTTPIDPIMEDIVAASLPYDENPTKIRVTLEECKGDINATVAILLEDWKERADNQEDLGSVCDDQMDYGAPVSTLSPGSAKVMDESTVEAPSPTQQPATIYTSVMPRILECTPARDAISATLEITQGDASRIKRRKSADGSPASATVSSSDDSSSAGSSGASSGASSGSSESDIVARRRRKPAFKPTMPPQPTRRSPRIEAKARLVAEALAAPSPPDLPQTPRPKRKYNRKKPVATGSRRQKCGNNMNYVTDGFRELYV